MKKSQINQAFTYIAMILVIGAIAILGTRAIMSLFGANCESKAVEFNSKFASLVDANSDRGTFSRESIPAACDAAKVCFISSSAMVSTFTDADPVIQESVRDGSYNVFVIGEFTTPAGKIEKLETKAGALTCVNVVNNYVPLSFSGTGRTTIVE
jgi:hypothetical protein